MDKEGLTVTLIAVGMIVAMALFKAYFGVLI